MGDHSQNGLLKKKKKSRCATLGTSHVLSKWPPKSLDHEADEPVQDASGWVWAGGRWDTAQPWRPHRVQRVTPRRPKRSRVSLDDAATVGCPSWVQF